MIQTLIARAKKTIITLNSDVVAAFMPITKNLPVRKSAALMLLAALLIQFLLPIPALASYRRTPEQEFTAGMFETPVAATTFATTQAEWLKGVVSKLGGTFGFFAGAGSKTGNEVDETDNARKAVENLAKKEALVKRVRRIETNFESLKSLTVGQAVPLAALPLDERSNAVHGVSPEWISGNETVLQIAGGQAVARAEGETTLTVKAGSVTDSVTVKITEIDKTAGNNLNDSVRAKDATAIPNKVAATGNTAVVPSRMLLNQLPDTERDSVYSAQNNLGSPPGQVEMDSPNLAAALGIKHRVGIANYSFGVPFAGLSGRGVNASVGMTYNSRTWNKSCTEYGAGGNCSNNHFTYDVEASWIAPGFSSGFGYLDSYFQARNVVMMNGSNTVNRIYNEVVPSGFTDSDGTRHQIQCRTWAQITGGHSSAQYCTQYETSDGSFVKIIYHGTRIVSTSANSSIYNGTYFTVIHSDGTKVSYSTPLGGGNNRRHYVTTIRDSNGNRIIINYKDASGKIDYILDTLNRYIRFIYEPTGAERLIAVTVPGFGDGSQDRQTIRFYYQENFALNTAAAFTGTVTAPATIRTLQFVYFPATQTGFKYDYHSSYGMITKITRLHGMNVSTLATDQTGMVTTEGTIAATTEYNYESGPGLIDVPKYTQRTDDWAGRTSATVGVTRYNSPDPVFGTDTVSSITVWDTDFDIEYKTKSAYTIDWMNGMVKETSVVKRSGPRNPSSGERLYTDAPISKTVYSWEQGAVGFGARRNPILRSVEIFDDAQQPKKVRYEYDGYNNQTAVEEYGFKVSGAYPTTPLRRTETVYQTGAGWVGANLLRLPIAVTFKVGNQPVSKTLIEYDNNGSDANIVRRDDVSTTTHDTYFNPAHPSQCRYICPNIEDEVLCDNYAPGVREDGCVRTTSYGYSPASAYRGNATKVVALSDATKVNETADPLASVTTTRYDILGNPVEASVNCCQKKTWDYGNNFSVTGYAYPIGQARGQSGQLISNATYDKNTGLMKTASDENGQITTNTYDPTSLRIIRTDYPNGGYTTNEYTDGAISWVKTKTRIDALKESESWQYADGRGAAYRARTRTPEGTYLSSDVEYDVMGRVRKSFNPYTAATINDSRPANIKATEVTAYDALGRTLTVKLQDDTTVNSMFSGTVTIVTDQAGKQRRQIADALGRITRVDEPDGSGNLDTGSINSPTQPTFYEYDGNDNLTKVTQTAGSVTQERVFVYDGLSRLIKERQPEMSPTLDDNGFKGTASSTKWTGFYKYNAFGLLNWGVDARGVKTTISYDTLNRAKTVAYTDETGDATPGVAYTYGDEATNPPPFSRDRITKIETTPATGSIFPATAQTFDYNLTGQVSQQTQQIGSQSYTLKYTYNLAGQMVSEEYPTGKVVRTSVDAMGRVARVYDAKQNYVSGFQYAGTGQLNSLFVGNGTQETYSYDANRLQLTGQTLLKGANILERYNYAYGKIDLATGNVDLTKNNGQLAKVDSYAGGTTAAPVKQFEQRFDYDSVGRLSESREYRGDSPSTQSYKQKFDYDRFGNQYHKAASNPTAGQQTPLPYTLIEDADINKATNRLATTSGTLYDEAGNVTRDTKFRSFDYEYDANNRMVKAHLNNVTPTPADSISTYDALGKRVATQIGNAWRFMVYDINGQMVCEYTNSAPSGAGSIKYLFTDRQGSTRAITDVAGIVQGRLDYTAFGEEIGAGVGMRTTAQGYGNGSPTRQKYALTERDEATELDHTDWRKNENRAGRWTSPDPYKGSMSLGDPQSFNRYAYTQNDPVNFVDPSGLNLIAFCWNYDTFTNDKNGLTTTNHSGCHYMEIGGGGDVGWNPQEPGGGGGFVNAPDPQQDKNCGVNPVTGKPGIATHPGKNPRGGRPGGLGNLRPGVGGSGGFRDRTGGKHDANDIVAPVGTPIFANRDGEVAAIQEGKNGGYGNTVILLHSGGIYTQYSHLSSISVATGDKVTEGTTIGAAGRTGNVPKRQKAIEDHVHFGVFSGEVNSRFRPARENWMDPTPYLNSPCPE